MYLYYAFLTIKDHQLNHGTDHLIAKIFSSKSKRNTIDPEEIIKLYGADAVRLFILSDSPPEKDVQWSDEGIKSSYFPPREQVKTKLSGKPPFSLT